MVTEKEYHEAVESPWLRPEFISKMDLGRVSHWVHKVKYIDSERATTICTNNEEINGTTIMGTRPKISSIFIESLGIPVQRIGFARPNILVYSGSFEEQLHPRLDDFLSTLIDHEGEHAKRMCLDVKGAFCGRGTLRNIIEEIQVYTQQIQRSVGRNCSPAYLDILDKNLRLYEGLQAKLAE